MLPASYSTDAPLQQPSASSSSSSIPLLFAPPSRERNHARMYNCAYMPMEDVVCFREAFFLLLSGTGVGFSVQDHHVQRLPAVTRASASLPHTVTVEDSIRGWADAVDALVQGWLVTGQRVVFDFSHIRPKGAPMVTSGGRASGSAPLQTCLQRIDALFRSKQPGEQLRSIEVHDIMCFLGDAVLAGGNRRSALISLFSSDDAAMISAKSGEWWAKHPQRARANNSAVLVREETSPETFFALWEKIRQSKAGEPGVYFTHSKDWGTNPCCEISLRPYQVRVWWSVRVSLLCCDFVWGFLVWFALFVLFWFVCVLFVSLLFGVCVMFVVWCLSFGVVIVVCWCFAPCLLFVGILLRSLFATEQQMVFIPVCLIEVGISLKKHTHTHTHKNKQTLVQAHNIYIPANDIFFFI